MCKILIPDYRTHLCYITYALSVYVELSDKRCFVTNLLAQAREAKVDKRSKIVAALFTGLRP